MYNVVIVIIRLLASSMEDLRVILYVEYLIASGCDMALIVSLTLSLLAPVSYSNVLIALAQIELADVKKSFLVFQLLAQVVQTLSRERFFLFLYFWDFWTI